MNELTARVEECVFLRMNVIAEETYYWKKKKGPIDQLNKLLGITVLEKIDEYK